MSGQHFVKAKQFIVARPNPESTTTPQAEELIDISDTLGVFKVLRIPIDATAGSVAATVTLPNYVYILDSVLKVGAAWTSGTNLTITNGTVDFLQTQLTAALTANAMIRATDAAQTFIDNTAANKEVDVVIAGTYDGGDAELFITYIDLKS